MGAAHGGSHHAARVLLGRPAGDYRDRVNANWRFVLRHGLHGFVGTLCVAVGALGVGWLPLDSEVLSAPVVGLLRGDLTGSLVSRGLVFLGLALLLQSWLVLGGDLRAHPSIHGRWRELSCVLAIWAAPLLLAPPLFSRDAYSYYAQGRLFAAGLDPTTTGVAAQPGWFEDGADPMWAESPTPYGPVFLAIERSIASFAHPNATLAGILFRLVGCVGVVLLLWTVPRLAALHGVDPDRATWLAVLNPLVLMHFVIGAHNDALMVGLVALGFWLALRCHCIWGAVAVGLAIAIKPIALLALPFIGLAWAGTGAGWAARVKGWLVAGLVAAATLTCTFLAVNAGYGLLSAALSTPAGVLTWLSPTTAIGQVLGAVTTWLGWTAGPDSVIAVVRGVGALTSLVIVGWLVLVPSRRSAVRGAALAIGAVILLGPVVHPWYLLWVLPLFAVTGLTRREQQVTVLVTAAFAVHGMVESSTTSDNFLDITDGITLLVAVAIVALIALASPQERALLLGTDDGRVAADRDGERNLGS